MELIRFAASYRAKFILLCLLGMSIVMVQSNDPAGNEPDPLPKVPVPKDPRPEDPVPRVPVPIDPRPEVPRPEDPARREIKLTVYIQALTNVSNATQIAVAGIQGKEFTKTQFGTIYVIDDKVTEGPNINLPEIGRLQGLFAVANINGRNLYDSFALIFTDGIYKGSTLEFQGIVVQANPIDEIAVVSGTGRFRFTRGYVRINSVPQDVARNYVRSRWDITLRRED